MTDQSDGDDMLDKRDYTLPKFVAATVVLVIAILIFAIFPSYKLSNGNRVYRPVWAPPKEIGIDRLLIENFPNEQFREVKEMLESKAVAPEWLPYGRGRSFYGRRFPSSPLFWLMALTAAAWYGYSKWLGVF